MLLYDTPMPAPNPRRVRIFLAEKGVEVPTKVVNILKRRQKEPEYLAKNSRGQVPMLELDDGTIIAETVAICRYFEEIHPEPPLFGRTAVEKAQVEMWVRRIEFVLMEPAGNVWRHAHPHPGAERPHQAFGDANRATYDAGLAWLDGELAGREFITGSSYTVADAVALATIDFATWIGLPLGEDRPNLAAWHARVTARPSASA